MEGTVALFSVPEVI